MKKLTFTFLAFALYFSAFAQNEFPTSNAIWSENRFHSWEHASKEFINYGLVGDTIIGDKIYNKLYELSDTIPSVENVKNYIGGFRQEGRKTFFRGYNPNYLNANLMDANRDILLYDFSANVGDTVLFYGNGFENYYVIEDILINNNIRIFRGSAFANGYFYNYFKWYEDIGNEFGLFGHLCGMPFSGAHWELTCLKHNDIVKYLNNPKCNVCFCSSLYIAENSYSDIINLYPNPAKDILYIEIIADVEIISFSLNDINGKLVKKSNCFPDFKQLNISKLKAGSYILNIETNKGNFSKMIIKN